MKLNLLKFKTKSHLKKNKTLRSNPSYLNAELIGVIFSIEDRNKHEEIKKLIKKFEDDGKKVKVFGFLPEHKENFEFLFDFFSQKEVSVWGTVASEHALQFANTPFDFLYCLDIKPNPYILNILARSKAKCRIGKFWEEGKPYFEFMIESVGGTTGLIEGVYKYSKSLR